MENSNGSQLVSTRRSTLNLSNHVNRSEEHTSELQSLAYLVCRLLLEKKNFYVAKYVNTTSDMDLAAKGLGAKEWNNSLKTKLSLLPKKLFRIRMSRNFGMKMLTMTNLSTECLIFLSKFGDDRNLHSFPTRRSSD